jgi:hypothetical protein
MKTIGERLVADAAALRELPAEPFEACHKQATKVSSQALVRYRTNDCSVPTAYGFRDVLLKGFVDEAVIFCEGALIARHARSYSKDDFVFDPRHYLALSATIGQRIRAASSPASTSRACCSTRKSPSAWTARAHGATMCLSSGCGAASNTRRSI